MTSQNIRNAVKAVLIKDNSILLIKHKNENVYYTLPGGGILDSRQHITMQAG